MWGENYSLGAEFQPPENLKATWAHVPTRLRNLKPGSVFTLGENGLISQGQRAHQVDNNRLGANMSLTVVLQDGAYTMLGKKTMRLRYSEKRIPKSYLEIVFLIESNETKSVYAFVS